MSSLSQSKCIDYFFHIKDVNPNSITNNTSLLRLQQISLMYLCFKLWAPDLNIVMHWLQHHSQMLRT